MLVTLNISDFALIERLTLDLEPGLNVFTGETGAGKSLIIQAFSLLLGERASSDLVRRGADMAGIQASFDVGASPWVAAVLERAGCPTDDGEGRVLISRDIGRQARSNRCFVNGRLGPVAVLKELGEGLVDLHGQHDHQRLLRTAEHLHVLDEFGGDKLLALRARVVAAVAELRAFEREIRQLHERERERVIERDNLRFQLDEIDAVAPKPGELDDLDARHRVVANADRLRSLYAGLDELLGGDEAVIDRLRQGWSHLDDLVEIDPAAASLQTNYHEAVYLLEDVAGELSRRGESVDVDEAELGELEERLGELNRLTRKYGPTLDDVLSYRDETKRRMADLDGAERMAAEADARRAALRANLQDLLPTLTKARTTAARRLEKAVSAELAHLGMGPATFIVRLSTDTPRGDDDAVTVGGATVRCFVDGVDRAEFCIATNEGEDPGPLARIASGGEVSRVMLAIKAALASRDRVPIMVFDEIDAGIGGETAWNVAEKLRQVSQGCQCLCITHLPQIAACADGHFHVEKRGSGGRTVIAVTALGPDERAAELARMLGGTGPAALEHAAELLARARAVTERSKA